MRYIDPDLKDFLRREDAYTELAVEVTAPDVGQVLRRATDQFFTSPPLVAGSQVGTMAEAARGGVQIAPTTATLAAVTTGADAATFALNQEDSSTRMKGLLWTLDRAFTQAALRTFDATIQRVGPFKSFPNDFQLQIYRITKTPGTLQTYNASKDAYTSSALTQYAFTPLLSPAALLKAASIVWTGDTGALHFDLSQYGLVLDNSPTPAAAPDQVGELPVYLFVLAPVQPPVQNTFFWVLNTAGADVVANVGTFQRSWWSRTNGDDTTPWTPANSADCPRFALGIDTYGASAQAVYALDLTRAPSAGTVGRAVLEQIVPAGTGVTLEIATAGSGGPWTAVKSGDVIAIAQQLYWARVTLASDATGRATPIAQGWGIEFRTPYDVSDIAITQLPTRDIAPPDCKASIAEGGVRIIREGAQDFLDLATVLGSQKPTSKLEVDVFLRSRHPVIANNRSKWLRMERLTVDDREPTKTSEALSLLSIAKKLKVQIPAQVESVNTVHTVTAATATAVQVTPVLPGTSVGGHEYNGLGYYARVRSSAAVTAGFSPTIAGSSGTNELDFAAGVLPASLNAGDIIEVHSGLLTTSVLKWQDADPADVWYAIFVAAGFPVERIGSADLPRSGFPPRVTDFEPGDATAQAKRQVTMQLTDGESADELLDQVSFLMGGATVERNGQMCFVQIYPGVSAAGVVTVPVAPVAAVFDARDLVAGSLRTAPMIASRKATVTATYGVNKAAANPDAYPQRVTNATDADAVEWLTQQDLETVGAMDLDDKVTRWLYNTADTGLYLASCVCTQVVRACSTGIRNFPFRVREPYPEIAAGDSVVVITDQYTDYDPSLDVAISGTTAIKGVVVHTADGGREFSIFVLGLSDNVQRIAGGAAGDPSATDTAPAKPALQLSFDANGHPLVSAQGAPGTLSMKVAVAKGAAPTDADVDAAAVISGDAASFSVAGITCASGETAYARAAAFSRDGALGARSDAATAVAALPKPKPPQLTIQGNQTSRAQASVALTIAAANFPATYTWALYKAQNSAGNSYGDTFYSPQAGAIASGDQSSAPFPHTVTVTPDPVTVDNYVIVATLPDSSEVFATTTVQPSQPLVNNTGNPIRGTPFSDGGYAQQALDAGGTRLNSTAVDYGSRAVNTFIGKALPGNPDNLDSLVDGTSYVRTTPVARDGGVRGYNGLSSAYRLQTGVDSVADIAGASANRVALGSGTSMWSETFDTNPFNGRWGTSTPAHAFYRAADTTYSSKGTGALDCSGGEVDPVFSGTLPLDPRKLYRMRCRVFCYSQPTTGGNSFFAGIKQYKADGTLANNNSGNAYICASGVAMSANGTWYEFTGWFKAGTQAFGVTGMVPSTDPTNPTLLNAGTVTFAPLFITNYNGGNGDVVVDYLDITEYDEDASVRTYTALDGNARLSALQRVPMGKMGGLGWSTNGVPWLSTTTWNGTYWVANIAAVTATIGGKTVSYPAGSMFTDQDNTSYFIYNDDPNYTGAWNPQAVPTTATNASALTAAGEGRQLIGTFTSGTHSGSTQTSPPPPPSQGGPTCVAPETLIRLADGREVPGGDIVPGDLVDTQHDDTLARGVWPVSHASVHITDRWQLALEDGRSLIATPNHRVYLWGAGWTRLDALAPGDVVMGAPCGIVQSVQPHDVGPVVQLTVLGAHTYMSAGLLSHNVKPV